MNRTFTTTAMVFLLSTSTGCNLGSLKLPDEIAGLTDRFVVQGLYLGIEASEDETIAAALEDSDFGGGGQVTVFFADAANVDEIEEAPITGLSPVFRSAGGGSFDLVEDGDGRYMLASGSNLSYIGGENVIISVDYADETHKVPMDTPEGASVTLAETHTAGSAMAISLAGQGFDTNLVTVIDVITGDVTYDNLPSDISDVLDLGGNDDEGTTVEIPGVAFATESLYAVGIGGLNKADTTDFEEVNTLLSGFKSGTMNFQPVCTYTGVKAELCDQ